VVALSFGRRSRGGDDEPGRAIHFIRARIRFELSLTFLKSSISPDDLEKGDFISSINPALRYFVWLTACWLLRIFLGNRATTIIESGKIDVINDQTISSPPTQTARNHKSYNINT
jgi:hypothetical protein